MHAELAERYALVVEAQEAVERRRGVTSVRVPPAEGDPKKAGT
ncbi:hypothetical protein [Sphingomonas yunnanensis]|nr:hypothetical protein [Sphingomonas yunnanensis]